MTEPAPKTSSRNRQVAGWSLGAIALAAITTLGVGGSAQGQDITPWRVCNAVEMPLAVDFGGLAAPNLVHQPQARDAILHGVGDDPSCDIYSLPDGL